jgi:DNA ligase (NAD+)
MNHPEYLKLIAEVNRLRNEVHLFNVEEISESALDDLKHKISLYEVNNPDKISANSPNYIISGGVAKNFVKFKHTRRMLSLNDIFSFEELIDWDKRWKDYFKKEVENSEEQKNFNSESNQVYVCEPKLDGLAISLHFDEGKLVSAATRGDGFVGELVTENIRQIKYIPKEIEFKGKLEVRGEVFLSKQDFEELNKKITQGELIGKMGSTGPDAVFANPRNAASGTIRQLNSAIVAERNLSFVSYNAYLG